MWFLGFVALPFLQENLPFVGKTIAAFEHSGIDVGDYYYSDVEECILAGRHMQHTGADKVGLEFIYSKK